MDNTTRPGMGIEAKSLGQILDTTFRLYGKNFVRLLLIGTVGFIPALLTYVSNTSSLTAVTLFVTAFQGAATVAVINDSYLGKERSLGEILAGIMTSVASLFGAVMIIGLGFAAVALVVFLSFQSGPDFILMGLIVVVVGIPMFFILLLPSFLFPSVAVIEKANVGKTIKRGFYLIQGFRFKAFAVFLIFIGLQVVLILGTEMLVIGSGDFEFIESQLSFLELLLIEYGISWFLEPLAGIGAVLVYYDARIRKEGFDLEVLARELTGEIQSSSADPS